MKEPIKVMEGKYGKIRIYKSKNQATKAEYYDLLRQIVEALIRKDQGNAHQI